MSINASGLDTPPFTGVKGEGEENSSADEGQLKWGSDSGDLEAQAPSVVDSGHHGPSESTTVEVNTGTCQYLLFILTLSGMEQPHQDKRNLSFVGSLPFQKSDKELFLFFSNRRINIEWAKVKKDERGASKGMGIVSFSPQDKARAISFSGTNVWGRNIKIEIYRWQRNLRLCHELEDMGEVLRVCRPFGRVFAGGHFGVKRARESDASTKKTREKMS
ncbi:hypothetical protein B0H13DRAFT_1899743 [Mycena leptocephala]|nr:hypothetical protein B0H13DRAFT_1899743 [Mycena leptocephala]